jgi:IS6 family transposase
VRASRESTPPGIDVDHVTVYRWVQRFTSELIDVARPTRHRAGDRWFVDETYVKVAGVWRYVYHAVDQHGQVIDVGRGGGPNRVECDHGRLKARLRPMRGLKTDRSAGVMIRGHAFTQTLRRGHYQLAVDAAPIARLAEAFDELRTAV